MTDRKQLLEQTLDTVKQQIDTMLAAYLSGHAPAQALLTLFELQQYLLIEFEAMTIKPKTTRTTRKKATAKK